MPRDVKSAFGYALHVAELGGKAPNVKPLKGMGAGVLEVVDDHDGDTYRAVYTVRFASGIYVLHAFQKKARSGIATPKHDIDLIKDRLKWAADMDKRLTT
jgi:phage-related protein